jgi:hypothetical protein
VRLAERERRRRLPRVVRLLGIVDEVLLDLEAIRARAIERALEANVELAARCEGGPVVTGLRIADARAMRIS